MQVNPKIESLSPDLQQYLSADKLILLSTLDYENNSPSISAISWVKPLNEQTVRIVVSNTSKIIQNITRNPNAVLGVIGLGTVYSIIGTCKVIQEPMEGVAIKLAKIEFSVENIVESMFWGAKIIQEPLYEKTYDLEKAKKLDNDVYSSLMK